MTMLLAAAVLMANIPAGATSRDEPTFAPHAGATCAPGPLERVATAHRATQLLVVIASSAGGTSATFTRYGVEGGCLREVGPASPARVGVRGLSGDHREGDGTTPLGVFGIGATMYGIAPDPGVAYAYRRLVCGDWWDEDPSTPAYNRFAHVPCGERPPFGAGSEELWTETPAYDEFAVIDYNTAPIRAGRGSAIFLHVAGPGPTDGCVAIAQGPLVATLRWLRPADHPVIEIELRSRA